MAYIYMFKQLWRYSGKERWKVIVYIILHAISIFGELGQPFAFAMIINSLQQNNASLISEVLFWLAIYVACFFVFELFHRSARFIEVFVAFRNRKRFVTAMYEHLQSLPLSWHEDNHSGAVIDRINKAASALHEFGVCQYTYISVIMKFFVPFIVLWQISPVVSIVAIFVGFLSIFITRQLYNLSVPEYRAQNEGHHKTAAALHDYLSNITTIIMLRLGGQVKKDLEDKISSIFPHIVRENKITHVKCFLNGFLMTSLNVGLIFYYIYSQNLIGSIIMIGSVTAIFQYLEQFMSSFGFYTGDYENVIHWKTDFEAIKPILDEKENINTKLSLGSVDINVNANTIENWNTIDIRSLYFTYGEGKSRLENISIQLRKGKRIAFVGESGAGKSTLLKILRGLMPIQNGSLVVDGKLNMPISLLSGITTLIPQEPEIFENTIRYNITMGIAVADEVLRNAVYTAGFSDVVERMPEGIDSDVREKGVTMSGGEKQRLALARGIFAIGDSSLVLLDEPTGSIDPMTEMMIFERIFDLLQDKCVVSVLHRLHLVRLFDYVYVFKHGEIVEEGDFDTLCNANGEFHRLWNNYLAEEDKA